jgi:hypothetical protein
MPSYYKTPEQKARKKELEKRAYERRKERLRKLRELRDTLPAFEYWRELEKNNNDR